MTLGEGNLLRLLRALRTDRGRCDALDLYPFYGCLVRADDEEVGIILESLPIFLPCFLWPRVRRMRLHGLHHNIGRLIYPEGLWELYGVQMNPAGRTLA